MEPIRHHECHVDCADAKCRLLRIAGCAGEIADLLKSGQPASALLVIASVLLAPSVEELTYRGVLLSGLVALMDAPYAVFSAT